jgi:antibiotic biosynthesis monooxygenase (ABM) superfamily enzyme
MTKNCTFRYFKTSPEIRAGYAKELDELTHGSATNAKFDGIQQLASPSSHIRKAETVVILILWILVVNQILSFALRPILSVILTPFWQNAVQTSIVVLIISYLLLPYTILKLTRLKAKSRS